MVELTATSAAPIDLEIEQQFEGSVGAIIPTVMIDVGNDGTFDLGYTSSFSTTLSQYVLGPQPLEVRIRYEGDSLAGNRLATTTTVRAKPRNDLLVTNVAAEGCSQSSTVLPVFAGRGVAALGYSPPINHVSVLAIGFAPEPVLLPGPFATSPCLLIPRPT